MNTSRKPIVILFSIIILLLLAALSCTIYDDFPSLKPDETDYPQLEQLGNTERAIETRTKKAWYTLQADSTSTKEAEAAEATEVFIRQLETQGAAEAETMIALATWEAENLIYGVEPQKVICEGEYTLTMTRLEEPVKSCSFTVPFKLEFYNVGALGGDEFSEVTFYWSYVNFQWPDCSLEQMTETTSTSTYSGGPDGSTSVTWATIQMNAGLTGTLTFSDEDETVTGTCTIDNPSAFSGWTGP